MKPVAQKRSLFIQCYSAITLKPQAPENEASTERHLIFYFSFWRHLLYGFNSCWYCSKWILCSNSGVLHISAGWRGLSDCCFNGIYFQSVAIPVWGQWIKPPVLKLPTSNLVGLPLVSKERVLEGIALDILRCQISTGTYFRSRLQGRLTLPSRKNLQASRSQTFWYSKAMKFYFCMVMLIKMLLQIPKIFWTHKESMESKNAHMTRRNAVACQLMIKRLSNLQCLGAIARKDWPQNKSVATSMLPWTTAGKWYKWTPNRCYWYVMILV